MKIVYLHQRWKYLLVTEVKYITYTLQISYITAYSYYNVVRQRYFNVSSLHELFDRVNAQNILGFIRDIGLYRLL